MGYRKYAIDMTRKSRVSQEFETVHIGKIIEEEFRRQERSVSWLSRKINCDRRNVYNIFKRASIDTDLLFRLSIALEKDFFVYFSSDLQTANSQQITPPYLPPFSWPKNSGRLTAAITYPGLFFGKPRLKHGEGALDGGLGCRRRVGGEDFVEGLL